MQNDKFGDHGDRYRTNAVEITVNKLTVGLSTYTNDPLTDGNEVDEPSRPSPIWRLNCSPKGSWKDGQVYSSPFYVGYRFGNHIERIGINHSFVQDLTQNGIHKWYGGGRQNYYLDYSHFNIGIYGYSGFYNPFSIWGR